MIHFLTSSPLLGFDLPGISFAALRKSAVSEKGTEKARDESCEKGESKLEVEGIALTVTLLGTGTDAANGAN